jgi:hypothetical protein
MNPPRFVPLVVGTAYLVLSLLLTWPLVLHLGTAISGFDNIDALDTIHLRGAVLDLVRHPRWDLRSTSSFFPVGFSLLPFMPNFVDQATALPFTLLLPFPWGDNAWWLFALTANGLAGHHLGRRIGGGHAAGALAGIGLATSEAVLREANLHHAPQALVCFAVLYVAELWAFASGGGRRSAIRAGLLFAASALTYWYFGLFLALGSAGLLGVTFRRWGTAWREAIAGLAAAFVLLLPGFLPILLTWGQQPLLAMPGPPMLNVAMPALDAVPESGRFVALHGSDPFFFLRSVPLDRSNRVSIMLLVAAFLGYRRAPRPERVGLAIMAATGALFVLGPVLKWGEQAMTVAGHPVSLPFGWLAASHPVFARLYWPERWGILVSLGLAALAAHAPRPAWLAAGVLLESVLFSGNLPLATQDLRFLSGWRALSRTSGAVLELPMRRQGLDAALAGLHQRYHGRPMPNAMILPPGSRPEQAWLDWLSSQAFVAWLADFEAGTATAELDPEALESLRAQGVSVLALDVGPDGVLTEGAQARYAAAMATLAGPPHDYGAVLAWWLDPVDDAENSIPDGKAWRKAASAELLARPPQLPDTLIKPSWWLKKGGTPPR